MIPSVDLTSLNDPQVEAVLFPSGPLVVFAGAGSGKTRVIVHRIAHLVLDHGVPPWRILAVTFTNRAAGEMKERLERLVPGAASSLAVGTFHSVCARLLRRHADAIGIARDFAIYDDGDQKAMIARVLKDLAYDEKRLPPKMIAAIINQARNELEGPETVALPSFDGERIREVFRRYEERMRRANALDFGGIIARLVQALEEDEALRLQLAGRFQHLLVDEFQDTNPAQFRLVRALASVHRNVVVVGDDDQSIYRWRGADRRNILDFRRYFPDGQVVKLEQNYRSTRRILRVAHAIISKNVDREPKELWTENPEGPKIELVRCGSERDEAELVVSTATRMREAGEPLSSLAVFYRIHAQSRALEEALRGANVPYRIVGGVRFYDRAEVKDLLAYLRLVANPEDDVSFLRVVNTPARGLGKVTIDRLLDDAARHGTGVWAAAERAASAKPGGALGRFLELVRELRDEAPALLAGEGEAREASGLAAFARRVLAKTGYEAVLREENTAESDARLENLTALVGSMEEFEDEERSGDALRARPSLATPEDAATREPGLLTRFLEHVTLETSPAEAGDASPREQLTLMTVHAAKGLEFDHVIVVGLEEQLFPFSSAQDDGGGAEAIEEERRLAYVAFTRARRTLTLAWATSRYVFGTLRLGTASRFLDDLPSADLERRTRGASAMTTHGFSGADLLGDRYDRDDRRAEGGSRGSARHDDGFERRSLHGASTIRLEPPKEKSVEGFARGMKVRHTRYGVGKVKSVEGGTPPTITVDFPGHGTKQIVAKYLDPA